MWKGEGIGEQGWEREAKESRARRGERDLAGGRL